MNELIAPAVLLSEAGMYDKYYNDLEKVKNNIGLFPWYSNSEVCEIPEGCFLITTAKKYDFGVRNLSSSLYIVSSRFLEVMKKTMYGESDAKEVAMVNVNGERVSDEKYFITRLPSLQFSNAANRKKSKFTEDDGRFELEKIVLQENLAAQLFYIRDLIGEHRTLFCSEMFHKELNSAGIGGIDIFEDKNARWQNLYAFLTNAGSPAPKNMVWPI